jgi:hypothetical protein
MLDRKLFARARDAAWEADVPVWICPEQGCSRHYDFNAGYYDFSDHGRLQGKYDSPYSCDDHEVKLYLKSHNHLTQVEVWQCPTRDCMRIETVRIAA